MDRRIALLWLALALGCGGRGSEPPPDEPRAAAPGPAAGAPSPAAVYRRFFEARDRGDRELLQSCFDPSAPETARVSAVMDLLMDFHTAIHALDRAYREKFDQPLETSLESPIDELDEYRDAAIRVAGDAASLDQTDAIRLACKAGRWYVELPRLAELVRDEPHYLAVRAQLHKQIRQMRQWRDLLPESHTLEEYQRKMQTTVDGGI